MAIIPFFENRLFNDKNIWEKIVKHERDGNNLHSCESRYLGKSKVEVIRYSINLFIFHAFINENSPFSSL